MTTNPSPPDWQMLLEKLMMNSRFVCYAKITESIKREKDRINSISQPIPWAAVNGEQLMAVTTADVEHSLAALRREIAEIIKDTIPVGLTAQQFQAETNQ